LLGIVVQGERRFHVERTKVRDNGLIVADVCWQSESPPERIRPEHQLLSVLLGRILERANAPFEKAELEDADWVGWRLAEWLPLLMPHRQALLQENDPHRRLQRLIEHLPEFQQA
jgi:Lon protease-like protein